jgi:hypothetical protein
MLSWPELVHSIFKTAQCIIKATSIDILHPKFHPAHCPDILSGLDFIFSYASMRFLVTELDKHFIQKGSPKP